MEEKDYKKLYEDVVALAKDGLKDGLYLSRSAKDVTEFLFPQLKETKDEKMRRELTRFLIDFNNGYYSRPSESKIDSWIKWIDEKCEQKPTDKVEPKFKVGDWVVYNRDDSSREIIQVYDIRDGRYYFTDNIHFSWSIKECDEKSHLWTIQDAKDGDVLYFSDETIAIFKDLYNATTFHSYCHIEDGLFAISKDDMPDWWDGKGFQPANKEQSDLLFSKMKEAGYEWDAEKKELNKIEKQGEQKPTTQYNYVKFREGDTVQKITGDKDIVTIAEVDTEAEVYRLTNTGFIPFKYEHLWHIVEQKSTWSEEDEYQINTILHGLDLKRELYKKEGNQVEEKRYSTQYSWLKSLKDRFQLQPKQEWSEEDSERLLRIHQFLWANRKGDTDEIYQQEQDADWIMTLKPHTKQEWSKEDEHCIELLLPIIDSSSLIPKNRKKCKDFLKSLKPKTHWKPSEAQMRALELETIGRRDSLYELYLDLEDLKNNKL